MFDNFINELRGAYGRKGKRGGSSKTPTTSAVSDKQKKVKLIIKKYETEYLRKKRVEHAGVFDEEGNLVIEQKGRKDVIEFTSGFIMALRETKNPVLTHNHPESDRAIPSLEDLMFAWSFNLSQMRIVGKKERMIIEPNEKTGWISAADMRGAYANWYRNTSYPYPEMTDFLWSSGYKYRIINDEPDTN